MANSWLEDALEALLSPTPAGGGVSPTPAGAGENPPVAPVAAPSPEAAMAAAPSAGSWHDDALAALLEAEDHDASADAQVQQQALDAEAEGLEGEHEVGVAPAALGWDEAEPVTVELLAHRARCVDDSALSKAALQALRFFMVEDFGVRSLSTVARQLGQSRTHLARIRTEGAQCAVELEARQWTRFQRSLPVDPEGAAPHKALFLEWLSYDGVDLWMGARSRPQPELVGQGEGSAIAAGEPGVSGKEGHVEDKEGLREAPPAPALTKVLHTEGGQALVLQAGDAPYVVLGQQLNLLQGLDRHTSENMTQALGQHSEAWGSPGLADSYRRKVRFVMTDGGANNVKTERRIMREREGWQHLHVLCNVHILSGIHRKVFDCMPQAQSGLSAYARSLQGGGYMAQMRKALLEIISERLSIEAVQPLSMEAQRYKDHILGLYVGGSHERMALCHVLCRFAPGDWRQPRFVWMSDTVVSRDAVLKELSNHFVPALLAHRPFDWPRHRWTGFERSLGDAGLVAAIHGLLAPTYLRFLKNTFGVKDVGEMGAGAAASEGPVPGMPAEAPAPAGQAAPSAAWAEANRQHRGEAKDWVQRHPDADVMLLSMVLRPMASYMHREMELTSSQALTEKMGTVATKGALGYVDHSRARQWPLCLAASGTLDAEAAQELTQAQSAEPFKNLPKAFYTVGKRRVAFVMFSRIGCCFEELIASKRRGYPFKVFRLLLDPGVSTEISTDCQKLMDPYSSSFARDYEGQLTSNCALAELMTLAQVGRTSTARLESLHAAITRILKANYHQTQQPEISTISAEYVLKRLRNRELEAKAPLGSTAFQDAMKAKQRGRKVAEGKLKAKAGRRKRRGGGGGQRAFLSQRLRAGHRLTKDLMEEYRSLPPAEKQKFREEGKAATATHRAGGPAFGYDKTTLQRERTKASLDARGALLLGAPTPASLSAVATAVVGQASVVQSVQQFRFDARCVRRHKRARQESISNDLHQWLRQEGPKIVNEAVSKCPALAKLAPGLVALPWANVGGLLRWVPQCGADCPRLIAFARSRNNLPLGASQNFLDALKRDWQQRHRLLEHHMAPQLPADAPKRDAKQKPPCSEAGLCLCTPEGQLTWRHRQMLMGALKNAVKSMAQGPQRLHSGDVVLRLVPNAEDPPGALQDSKEMWLHVGLHYMSPWRPTFRRLQYLRALEENKVEVRGSDSYCTTYEVARQLATSGVATWTLSLYELVSSETPIANFDPRIVWARRDEGPEQMWSTAEHGSKAAGGGPQRKAKGWDAQVEALIAADEEAELDIKESHDEEDLAGGGYDEGAEEDGMSEYAEGSPASSLNESMWCSESELPDDDVAQEEPLPFPEVDKTPSPAPTSSPGSSSSASSSSSGRSEVQSPEAAAEAPGLALAAEPEAEEVAGVPPADVGAGGDAGGPRGKADLVLEHPNGGVLRYYAKKDQFVAHCPKKEEHGAACCLTRSTVAGARRGQGRPLGLLLSWMKSAELFDGHDAHVRMKGDAGQLVRTFDERLGCRMEAMGLEQMVGFFAAEREKEAGEGEEPERIA